MRLISDVMYWITSGLMVPVIVLLIFLFFRALILIGSFFGQYINLRKSSNKIDELLRTTTHENVDDLNQLIPEKTNSLFLIYLRALMLNQENPDQLQRYLSKFEIAADKDLSSSKTLSKMGPILGLMGTLIPMGPALVGLSQGDIASMAYNMQVAFATTVIGLLVGAIGYLTIQVKQRWFLREMVNLEYVVELLNKKHRRI